MELHDPVIITPRLLAGVKIGKAFISIDYAEGTDRRGAQRYRWFIDLPNGDEYEDDNLFSPGGLQDALATIVTFLASAAEYTGEDWDEDVDEDTVAKSFPRAVVVWANKHQDDLFMLEEELGENELIEE